MYIYLYIYISRGETKLFSFSSLNVNLIHLIPLATVIIASSRRISRERTLVPPPPCTNDYFCPLFSRKRNESAYTGRNEPRALWKALIKLTGSLIAAPRISWAFRVPQIPGNGTPRFLLFTTKRTRNGQDPRWIPCPLRIEFDHLFAGTNHENVANFVVEFIYLLFSFFWGGGEGGQENLGTSGESLLAHTNDTEFNSSAQVFRTWRSSGSWSFETRIYIFYEPREELSTVRRERFYYLSFCINFHWFSW